MIEKGKQITLSQRNKIEEMLNQRRRKFEIANELDKTQSTIAREINRHKICNLDKYFYFAEEAHKKYKYTLTDSRQGVNLNTSELIELAHLICPLIKKGQSIYTILNNHPEIKFCEKTIYNYIEMGLFKDWGVTNITLKRKIRRRLPNK